MNDIKSNNIVDYLNKNSKIKIIYFNEGGLAEPIRMILRYRGVNFEDIYITKEEWNNGEKEKQPWGKLPVVTIEKNNSKEVLCQSKSILKYFGNILNLNDDLYINRYKIDEFIETMDNTFNIFSSTNKLNLKDKIEERQKLCYKDGVFWYWLKLWNKKVKKNDFLVNSKMTIADLYVYSIFKIIFGGSLEGINIKILNEFSNLKNYLNYISVNYYKNLIKIKEI